MNKPIAGNTGRISYPTEPDVGPFVITDCEDISETREGRERAMDSDIEDQELL